MRSERASVFGFGHKSFATPNDSKKSVGISLGTKPPSNEEEDSEAAEAPPNKYI